MDLDARKLDFIQEFLKLKNEEKVAKFEKLLIEEKQEINLEPFSEEELNQRINQSEIDFKKGDYKTTSELLEKYQKLWK